MLPALGAGDEKHGNNQGRRAVGIARRPNISTEPKEQMKRTEESANLRCNECGATATKRGELFTVNSLSRHMSLHRAVERRTKSRSGLSQNPANEFECGICGAKASNRGRPFNSEWEVNLHKAKAHKEASHGASAENHRIIPRRKDHSTRGGPVHSVKFCPRCGLNLEVIGAAIGLLHP